LIATGLNVIGDAHSSQKMHGKNIGDYQKRGCSLFIGNAKK
jgi:hypothetical protein